MPLIINQRQWQLSETGLEFQPNSIFGYDRAKYTGKDPKPPKGYDLWLRIICAAENKIFRVYYPTEHKRGNKITVLIDCPMHGIKRTSWIDGEYGLTESRIIKHLKNVSMEPA